jgi:AcrR family transcriptional regulator
LQRADARTNRARILEAADEVFGAGGAAASTEDVARLAGLGIATVFRHFPTKVDLLTAVLAERLDQLAGRARELMADPELDPGDAFVRFFTEVVDDASTKVTIADALSDAVAGTPQDEVPEVVAAAGERLRQAFGDLLRRAQAAGGIRDDVAPPETYALMVGTSRAVVRSRLPDQVKNRMLAVVFDGLRPTTHPP